jgi:glycosyltransferase involved in cell wall biosynthesis
MGGVGSYLEEIVPLQVERFGVDSVRIVLPAEHAEHCSRLPGPVLRTFPAKGSGRLGSSLRMAAVACAELRRMRPDVVHLHSTFAGFMMRPLLSLLSGHHKVVYCAHGWAFDRDGLRWQKHLYELVERIWSCWCDRVVCVSRSDVAGALRIGIAPHRIRLVVNGIQDQQTAPAPAAEPGIWPEGRLRVLFVGRLDQQKGLDVLLKAMEMLGDRAFAVVVGTPVVGGKETRGIPCNVRMLGWLSRDQISSLYSAADVLVISSRWEAFGLVAVEAMRAGVAVVATRVGGLPEVVQDGVTGFLVDRDSPEKLAHALSGLDRQRLVAMGAAGRQRYLRLFQAERLLEELGAVYRSLNSPCPARPTREQPQSDPHEHRAGQ